MNPTTETNRIAGLDGADISGPADFNIPAPDAHDGAGKFSREQNFSAPDPLPEPVANLGQDRESAQTEPAKVFHVGQDRAEQVQAASGLSGKVIPYTSHSPLAAGEPRENSGSSEPLSCEKSHDAISEHALKKGSDRALILKAAMPLLAPKPGAGPIHSQAKVASALGVSEATLCRLVREFGHLSLDEMTPERLAGRTMQCGRKSPWSKFALKLDVRQRLKELYFLTCGASSDYMATDRRTGSASLVLERFADDALCPADLAALLRCERFPEPLLRIIREITPDQEQQFRGAKHQGLNGTLIHRRTTSEFLANGSERQIELGDWWVFDDASDNQPFWFLGSEQQPLVGRQGLYAFDVLRHWLGVELVGTSRDSYTAAIILRFVRRLMAAMGRPRRGVVFEQSVWKARVISGFRVSAKGETVEEQYERAEMAEAERNMVQDGLKALGIEVYYTHTPRGKEIESGFNYLQRVAPTFSKNQINIGRHAGEFEQGAKNLRRAHNHVYHPKDLGFAHIDARADVLEQTMQWINARQARKSESERIYPTLAPLSDRDLTVFLPSKHELELNGGKVTCTVDGEKYDFCHPELFASLGAGYRVFVKCDPSEPTLGAAIYNRETSSANWKGWPVGQFIGMAPFLPSVPRFDFRAKDLRDNTASDAKKRYNKSVRTSFRAVGMPQFRAATARDGKGNVATVSSTPDPKLPLPPRRTPPADIPQDPAQEQAERERSAREANRARRLISTDD